MRIIKKQTIKQACIVDDKAEIRSCEESYVRIPLPWWKECYDISRDCEGKPPIVKRRLVFHAYWSRIPNTRVFRARFGIG